MSDDDMNSATLFLSENAKKTAIAGGFIHFIKWVQLNYA
jgi:hypothetical protein